ncbi:bifunctional diguanylate cyclase/phosphodiesterase [Oxalobacteraceae bacterium OM1]|nr:bifunctional diguanylate cyclase/phosphodiesterase [Oxalobacteraceae bacterium OM1]
MLVGTYNSSIVFASVLIAALASYTTLQLASRIATLQRGSVRRRWLAGGACAMGLGIWSMHFVGMLAFSLPIPLGYDPALTLLSLAIAVTVAYFALDLVTQADLSHRRLGISGILLGLGIASMHYTGMFAMRMAPGIEYDLGFVVLSIAIAIAAATAALWIAFTLRHDALQYVRLRRIGAALVMGIAIAGMHYTGMYAANFPAGSICGAASDLSLNWLAVTILVITLNVLTVALVLSVLDSRMERSATRFTRSLQYQATHDALTGLPNRYLLSDRVHHAIERSARAKTQFALYFIDLDAFKAINDSLGHSVGDQLLKAIADRLRQAMRKEDTVARIGGDEFVVLAEELAGFGAAVNVAEKVLAAFKTDIELPSSRIRTSPSIGISLYPDDGTTIDTLLSHADAAMYEAKASGRNAYRFFEEAMNIANKRAIEIQQGLHHAIESAQLFLQYQPKWDCRHRTLLGAEALLRWHHPELGLVSPAEFIPAAEQSGQIIAIDLWVIEQVCRQLIAWRDAGLAPIRIAVNLSRINFRSPALVDEITRITDRYAIDRSMLMFEITESVAMQNAEATKETIERMQQAGFDLAIDDFGTGYSSLSYLQQFSVRQLKVDRMFVSSLCADDSKAASVVAAIINLAHALDMEVVAEGVETEAQLTILRTLSCDAMQGYLLAKPLPSADFANLLQRAGRDNSPAVTAD